MAMPKLLALDEPSLGLSPLLVAEVMRVLKEITDKGTFPCCWWNKTPGRP